MKRLLILFVFPILFTQCAKSDEPKDPAGSGLGWIELEVRGAVNGKFSGMADFYGQTVSGITMWGISGHDFNPQTFSVSFDLFFNEDGEIKSPAAGQYTIGYVPQSKDVFNAIYIDVAEVISESVEYGPFESKGTLNLEKSNNKEVIGNFQFTTESDDGAEIQVSGEFVALARQF